MIERGQFHPYHIISHGQMRQDTVRYDIGQGRLCCSFIMLFNWKTLLKVAKRNSKTTLYHQSKVQSNTHAGFKLTYRVTKTFRTKV